MKSRVSSRVIAPAVAVLLAIGGALGGHTIDRVQADVAEGFRSTAIAVGDADASTRLVVVQDGVEGAAISSIQINLPVGRPTLLAAFDDVDNTLKSLALSAGDGNDVALTPRSTAATLISLSPGVLVTDGGWIGLVGHAIESPAFELLVDAIEQSSDLRDPAVRTALSNAVASVAVMPSSDCTLVCGERLAESEHLLVRNSSLFRAVASGREEPVVSCGAAAPALRIADSASFAVATDMLRGAETEIPTLGLLRAEETLARILTDDPCPAELLVSAAGAANESTKFAWWSSMVLDYAGPLVQIVGDIDTLETAVLDATVNELAAGEAVPDVATAVRGVLARSSDLSADQLHLIDSLLPVVSDGLFASDYTNSVSMVVPAAVAAEVAPPSTSSTTTTTTTTTTVPEVIAPPEVALTASYFDQPASGEWVIDISLANSGTEAMSLGESKFLLRDRRSGDYLEPLTPPEFGVDTLAAGSSLQAQLRFDLPAVATMYDLVCIHNDGGAVVVTLT